MADKVTDWDLEILSVEPQPQACITQPDLRIDMGAINEMVEAANKDKAPENPQQELERQFFEDVDPDIVEQLVAANGAGQNDTITQKIAPEKRGAFREISDVYTTLAKKPSLVLTGTLEVLKNTLWELPKSLGKGTGHLPMAERLIMKSKQAVLISEIVSATATYKCIELLREFGAGEWVNGIICSVAANYVSAVLSYVATYLLLTLFCKGYSPVDALKDSGKVVRNLVPFAGALYITNRPITIFLQAFGLSPEVTSLINTIWGNILFTGVASTASDQQMSKKG